MRFRKKTNHEVTEGLQALFPRLWRYCVALTGSADMAGDLAQATCLRAIEKSDQFEPGSQLDRWVFRIAQRTWLNDLRARSVRRGGGLVSVDDIEITDTKPNPELNYIAREVLMQVMALPEAQRIAVMLVYVEGYSYKEAAELMDIPIGTVMSRLAAARTKISTASEQKNDAAQ